jgi:hypothetical protein
LAENVSESRMRCFNFCGVNPSSKASVTIVAQLVARRLRDRPFRVRVDDQLAVFPSHPNQLGRSLSGKVPRHFVDLIEQVVTLESKLDQYFAR